MAKLTATDLRWLTSLVQALLPLTELTDTLQAEFGSLGAVLLSVAEVQSLLDTVKSPIAIRIFAKILQRCSSDHCSSSWPEV